MIFRSSQFYSMRCSGCMYAEVSPISPVPCIYFYPICHRLRLRVKCHRGYNPSTLFLNSLYAEDKWVPLVSRVYHQPCLTEFVSSGPFLKNPLNSSVPKFLCVSRTYQLFLNYSYPFLNPYILAGALIAQSNYLPWKTLGHIRKKNAVNITVPL